MDPPSETGKPIKLSSSVSVYIDDYRISGVTDEDIPKNQQPTTISSTYIHTPIVNSPKVEQRHYTFSHSSLSSDISNAGPSSSHTHHPWRQKTRIKSGSTGSLPNTAETSRSSSFTSSVRHARPSSLPYSSSSRPREIKVIRESSLEEQENNPNSNVPEDPPFSRGSSVIVARRSQRSTSSATSLPADFGRTVRISASTSTGSDSPRRRRTTTNILPVTPQLPAFNQRFRDSNNSNRTFTSVNLTLRSPSADAENVRFNPEGTAFCACGGSIRVPYQGGNTMTYSTYSSGANDGFEAQVQIHIGPNGGTISASRRRREDMEIQQMNADLISAQEERKEKLHAQLVAEKADLELLQQDIAQLRSKLNPLFHDLEKLKDENQRLRIECQLMTREVDLYDNGTVPLGETSEEFYRDIYPGQDLAPALFGSTNNRRRARGPEPGGNYSIHRKPPPPRPPPPNPKLLPQPRGPEDPNSEWMCSMCTFLNHPDLTQCEQCSMVRVRLSKCTECSSEEHNISLYQNPITECNSEFLCNELKVKRKETSAKSRTEYDCSDIKAAETPRKDCSFLGCVTQAKFCNWKFDKTSGTPAASPGPSWM